MAAVHTIGAHAQAGEIPGNGCLASVSAGKQWSYRTALAGETGPGKEYPLALTMDQLMETYWRWRKLECTYTINNNNCNAAGTIANIERKTANDTPINDVALMTTSTPWDVLETADPWHDYNTGANPNPPSAPYPATYYDLRLQILNHQDSNVLHTGSYHPQFILSLEIYELGDEILGLYSPCAFASTQNLPDRLPHQTISLTIELSAQTLTIPLYNLESSTTGGITLKATEYWPHEKPNGAPKFSTTTGARL